MDPTSIIDSLENLIQPQYLYLAGCVLVLAFILILITRGRPKNVMAYSTSNGRVMVSRSAIVELVQTSCEQIKEVTKPQVRINVKGNKTHFEVRLKLQSGANLRSIEEILQTHLRKALTENLGIENLGRINVVATGFKSGRVEQTSSLNKKEISTELEAESTEIDIEPDEPEAEAVKSL